MYTCTNTAAMSDSECRNHDVMHLGCRDELCVDWQATVFNLIASFLEVQQEYILLGMVMIMSQQLETFITDLQDAYDTTSLPWGQRQHLSQQRNTMLAIYVTLLGLATP